MQSALVGLLLAALRWDGCGSWPTEVDVASSKSSGSIDSDVGNGLDEAALGQANSNVEVGGDKMSTSQGSHITVIAEPVGPSSKPDSQIAEEGDSECTEEEHCDFSERLDKAFEKLQEELRRKSNPRRLPPRKAQKPVVVTLDIRIERIGPLKDEAFNVDLYICERWVDKRLKWDTKKYEGISHMNFLIEDDINEIWTPGTAFFHASVLQRRVVDRLIVFQDGLVEYTQHFLMTVRCMNKDVAFPFDSSYCQLRCGSYIWNKTEVDYLWKGGRMDQAVFFANGSWEFDQHRYQNGTLEYHVWEGVGGAHHRQMVANFHMSRIAQRYLFNIYVPVFCVAFIAYCSYWIGPYAAPARATIGVITVLTCTIQLNNTQKIDGALQLTALDLYVLFNLLFCIMAMAEYSIVNFLLSIAFGMNPPKSELGMRHKHVRARWRLTQLALMRLDLASRDDGMVTRVSQYYRSHRVLATLRQWAVASQSSRSRSGTWSGDGPSPREHSPVSLDDSSDDDEMSDEDDQPFEEDELRDFFAAADRSLKESLSFEDVLSVVELLGLDSVPEDQLRKRFDSVALSGSDLKLHHQKDQLDFSQFRAFMAVVMTRRYGSGERGRGCHIPVWQHPLRIVYRRRVTWRLEDDPTVIDSWMRICAAPLLLAYNVLYAWIWCGKDCLAEATRGWVTDCLLTAPKRLSL